MSSCGSRIELLGQNKAGVGGKSAGGVRDIRLQGSMFGKGGIGEQLWASQSS